jgi:hypothetical protein
MGENVNDGRDGVDDVFFPPAVKKTRVVLSRLFVGCQGLGGGTLSHISYFTNVHTGV